MEPQQQEPAQVPFSEAGIEDGISLALEYKPILSVLQELSCLLVVAGACVASSFVGLPPLLATAMPSWQAAGMLAMLAVTMWWLVRNALLEGMYKAREQQCHLLGDADSSFLAVDNLAVHIKCKVSSGLHAAHAASRTLPALHCYHGFGANLGSYMLVQNLLAERLQGIVTAHDMPGFGLTQRPTDLSSYSLAFNGRLGRLVMDMAQQQQLAMRASAGCCSGAGSAACTTMPMPRPAHAPLTATDSASSLDGLVTAAAAAKAARGGAKASARTPRVRLARAGPSEEKPQNGAQARPTQPQAAAGPDAAGCSNGSVKRVLVGHSLGGACAALEALSNPEGISALVLVAPAILALPGSAYSDVTLSAQRSSASGTMQELEAMVSPRPRVSSSSAGQSQPAFAQAPVGSHPTDPLTLRRLYPVGEFPRPQQQQQFTTGRLPARLLHAAIGAAQALVLLVLLRMLQAMAPAITLALRMLVRSRAFWQHGLQHAYYNPSLVTSTLVDIYRMPQLVRGWEAGMVNFLLARLALTTHTSGAFAAHAKDATADAHRATGAVDEEQSLAARLGALVAAQRLPVLIIHGEQDRLVPASNSQRLARMLPGCELLLLDRCGHMPQEEAPQLFCDLVCEFVSRVGPHPAPPSATP